MSQPNPARLAAFLHPSRVCVDVAVSSRKKLFEYLAKLLSMPQAEEAADAGLDADAVLDTLNKRERLGCTGIGDGIALPHGRLGQLTQPRIAVVRLQNAVAYDAEDGVPVWLSIALLVPQDASDAHLQLLADVATQLTQPQIAPQLQNAHNADELRQLLTRPHA